MCVSFVDVFAQKGYKLLGQATLVPKTDARFPQLAAPLAEITRGAFPIHGVIEVHVSSVEPILAPSYRLVPGTTEESQIESAMVAYRVKPLETS